MRAALIISMLSLIGILRNSNCNGGRGRVNLQRNEIYFMSDFKVLTGNINLLNQKL